MNTCGLFLGKQPIKLSNKNATFTESYLN